MAISIDNRMTENRNWPPLGAQKYFPEDHMDERTPVLLRIGELATAVELNPKTIRYYEAIGLLPAAPRNASGYRVYGTAERDRLRFIAKAKAIGFTLREIGQILATRDGGNEPCPYLGELLADKLATIDTQVRLLGEIRQELLALQAEMAVTACSSTPICGPIERHELARLR
jgi:MerR family transcriptional regulator, Zn(II)-responsive regulator of zntA